MFLQSLVPLSTLIMNLFLHGVIDNFEQFKFSIFFAYNSSIIEMISVLLCKKSKEKVELPKGLENQSH